MNIQSRRTLEAQTAGIASVLRFERQALLMPADMDDQGMNLQRSRGISIVGRFHDLPPPAQQYICKELHLMMRPSVGSEMRGLCSLPLDLSD